MEPGSGGAKAEIRRRLENDELLVTAQFRVGTGRDDGQDVACGLQVVGRDLGVQSGDRLVDCRPEFAM